MSSPLLNRPGCGRSAKNVPPKFSSVPGEDRNVTRARLIVRDWNRDAAASLSDLSEKWMLPLSAISYTLFSASQHGDYVRRSGAAH